MLTWEDEVEVHALHKRGWSISAIARHTGRDRKTVRAYLNGERTPGERKKPEVDPFEKFVEYVTSRLLEDPHLWSRTLCDELEDLGYTQSYQTLTRQIRVRKLRPVCPQCATATDRANAIIPHPPGEETQWDWLELPNPPASWGWGSTAYLIVGTLAHSGRYRAYLAPDMKRPQVIAGIDRICRALGGVTKVWRFDRMATVCHPDSGKLTAEFAAVAKYYGVSVKICPPRRGNRKGCVESTNKTAAQRWWRHLADDPSPQEAQADLDKFSSLRGDTRMRPTAHDNRQSVATIAKREPLTRCPSPPYPAVLTESRRVSRQALISWRGNQYSVPPEFAMGELYVSQALDAQEIDIATDTGSVVAHHTLAPEGSGAQIRIEGHVMALDELAKAAAVTGGRPHRKKERIPPGERSRNAAEALRTNISPTPIDSGPPAIDLAVYETAAQNRNTLP
ncbi:IS21/IS408/IS1162 family transposase [Gordonia sp. NPDC003504]